MDSFEPFKLFRVKARKLLESSFASEMKKPNGVDISWTEEGQTVIHRGPNQESIDAYLLTFRFFIQGNESISFKKMAESFQSDEIDEHFFDQFNEAKESLNEFLDGNTMFNVNGFVSRRELMETFIYGDLAHANYQDKRAKHLSWMSNPLMAELMKNEFRDIIGRVLIVIARVDHLCTEVLNKHERT